MLVVSALPHADATLEHATRLAGRISAVIAGQLGPAARSHPDAAALAAARLAAAKQGALLYVEPSIEAGKLRVVANLYPISRSFWDRVKNPRPNATGHAFAERALDPEIRSFLAPIPLVAKNTTLAAPPELGPVALACVDADRDGSPEIAFVGRRRVALGRIRGGRLQAVATRAWSELSPIAPTPLRDPIAAVTLDGDSRLDIGSSDRERFVRLDAGLGQQGTAQRRIPFGLGCFEISGHRPESRLVPCMPGDAEPPLSAWPSQPLSLTSLSLLNAHARATSYFASYSASEETIEIFDERRQVAKLEGAGAQLALADLNGDGRPELLSSKATLVPSEDALVVHTLTESGQLEKKLSIPIPDGITAIAACPQPTAAMAPIVVGTRGRLWVIQ